MTDLSIAKYSKIMNDSNKINESNDCVVKAVAIACNRPYMWAWGLTNKLGRKPRQGMYAHQAVWELVNHGYKIKECSPLQPNGSKYTPISIHKITKRGRYIAVVSGHALAIVNGKVYDWTSGRRHRINTLYRVIKCQ